MGGWRARAAAVSLPVAVLVGLTGCGDKLPRQLGAGVAARVNGETIEAADVESLVAQQPRLSPAQKEVLAAQWLDRLIDWRLIEQAQRADGGAAAHERARALDLARREAEVRLWRDEVLAGVPRPRRDEVEARHAAQADRYSGRRLLRLREIALEAPAERQEALVGEFREALAAAGPAAAIERWRAEPGTLVVLEMQRGTEQIAPATLALLDAVPAGQPVLLPTGGSGPRALVKLAERPAPWSLEEARPFIEAEMQAERQRAALTAALEQLRRRARIERAGSASTGGRPERLLDSDHLLTDPAARGD